MLNLILRPGMVHKLKEHIYSFVNVVLKLVIRFRLLIAINQRILNYLLYLQNKQPDSLLDNLFKFHQNFTPLVKIVFTLI